MPHREWSAPRALGRAVAGLAASRDAGRPEAVRVLPDGGADLLFSARAAGGAWTAEVFGPKTRALVVADAEPMEKLAVRLRPGTAARWLGVPAHALADRAVPLDALWGRAAAGLAARLADAAGDAERRALLEAALRARLARLREPPALVEAAVASLAGSGGRLSVREVGRALGASERRLERAFREHVGLSPKRFARIVRLGAARRALAAGARSSRPRSRPATSTRRTCTATAGRSPAPGPRPSWRRRFRPSRPPAPRPRLGAGRKEP